MYSRTEILHQRVTKLVTALIGLEQKLRGGSVPDALERLVLRASNGPEAQELMYQESLKDPQLGSVIMALAERAKLEQSKKSKRKGRKRF